MSRSPALALPDNPRPSQRHAVDVAHPRRARARRRHYHRRSAVATGAA